jgi:hypothetical protein
VPQRIRVLGLFLLLAGCDDLREFKTAPDQVFRGEVVGSDADQSTESFIRKGFPSHTLLELRFNPDASGLPIPSDASISRRPVPGMIHTYTCPAGQPRCDEDARTTGPFDHAELLSMESLSHDTLSQYTFPGGGRLRNYIFGARFTGQKEPRVVIRDAMIFVSLMETDQIEVRAMAPAVEGDTGTSLPALYGVFVLSRRHL